MRKEAIIAILLGVGLGLVFTFGVYTANQAVKDKKTEQTVQVVETSPSPSPQAGFTIDSPENNIVVDKDEIEISGETQPEAVIVAYSEEKEIFSQADEDGKFSFDFPLVSGSNTIVITSINDEDEQEEMSINVVYTTKL